MAEHGTGREMEYITSRRYTLPASAHEFRHQCWLNLWRRREWPYSRLMPGDILYWYETPTRVFVWKSRVARVERFPYTDKSNALATMEAAFGYEVDRTQPYFVDGPDQGYCLAYTVDSMERLCLPRPDGVVLPRLGWMRIDDEATRGWVSCGRDVAG